MNLQYYSYEEDQVYEYDSETISKITEKKNSFDLTSKFELSKSKKNRRYIFTRLRITTI